MLDLIIDALMDSVKLLPFLLITYIAMEYIESRIEDGTKLALKKSGKTGPLWGAALGLLPQCGFSAAASNLYAGRVITVGTLLAIYLSTSDEMLPILISQSVSLVLILKILLLKLIIGMAVGFAVDFIYRKKTGDKEREVDIHHFCEHEHCSCGQGILKPAIVHTVKIFLFILLISICLNFFVDYIGLESVENTVLNSPVIGQIIAGLIGLIPNCGSSVAITSFYLNGAINFGTMMSGLLVNAGVGILVLLRVNENKKDNIRIISLLYVTGVLAGIMINLFV